MSVRLSAAKILGRRIVMTPRRHIALSVIVEARIANWEELRRAMRPGARNFRLRCVLRAAQSGGWWMRQLGRWDRSFYARELMAAFTPDREYRATVLANREYENRRSSQGDAE